MKILLAGPRGFCAGVNMAIDTLELALQRFGAPLYVYHEIVHNKWVVERFRRAGVVFVDCVADVPDEALLVYSAHGVSPEIRGQAAARRLRTIDATCPLVTKVHREAIRFVEQGHTVVLIGHAGHDEVIGTMGEAPGRIDLVENVEDVDRLVPRNPEKIAYLTQTTLSIDDAARIIARLKQRFPQAVGPAKDDICYATQNRQEAVKELAARADVVLVVGSRNSSNSQRLAELARSSGRPAHLIDDASEIVDDWFRGGETVLITAGASAPESVVAGCVGLLQERFAATVENAVVRREDVYFQLPRELRTGP